MMLTCSKCGWVHMGRTLAEVTREIGSFNAYFHTLDQAGKDDFGGQPSSMERYKRCFSCGGSNAHMRAYREGDLPKGRAVTIQPVLDPVWN